jgi:rhamnose utilization protein RhaD (predicted bifunctional aldolase and dehydrogenase)
MKKTFTDLVSAREFAKTLYPDEKNYVEFSTTDNCIEVRWIEIKTYIAFDGMEFPDELWTTKEGEMLLIQDLTSDHARNIIRMMLRQERNLREYFEHLAESLKNCAESVENSEELDPDSNHTLH